MTEASARVPDDIPAHQIQILYKVEKCGPFDFIGDRRVVVRKSLMETRIGHGALMVPSHDPFKVKHCADILNFVLITKLVETTMKHMPRREDPGGVRTELEVEITNIYDEVPGQYWDFAQRIIAHLHFLKGWLLAQSEENIPYYSNEAMYLRHWLMAALDGLTAECRSVFPRSQHGRQRYPATWRSQTLGGCLSNFQLRIKLLIEINQLSPVWSEFLETQPLLKTWIEMLMTVDDIWNLAAIDTNLKPGIQADKAMVIGMKAAMRVGDAKAKASAANEGGGFQPTEATQAVDRDAVMEDFFPVSYNLIFEPRISLI
jgi:hypothetical protein